MFTFKNLDPVKYREATRKSSFVLIIIFAASALISASLLVMLFGEGPSNFKLNLTGVLLGLLATLLLVKFVFSKQPFMQDAVYMWGLKRSLMAITNKMHLVEMHAKVARPEAIQLLAFYYLALEQMHKLEGNTSQDLENKAAKADCLAKLEELGLPLPNQFNPSWLTSLQTKS